MNKAKWIFCNLVLKLDWIPRYGRLYPYEVGPKGRLIRAKPEWTYQRRGRWGMYFLDRIDLLWPWVEEAEKRQRANKKEPDATP